MSFERECACYLYYIHIHQGSFFASDRAPPIRLNVPPIRAPGTLPSEAHPLSETMISSNISEAAHLFDKRINSLFDYHSLY